MTAVGGISVTGRSGEPSARASWADIAAAEPELVVVAPCGYHVPGAAEQAGIAARELPGVPVWAIDPTASSSAPAPGWSPGLKRSPLCCTPAVRRPPRPAPYTVSDETAKAREGRQRLEWWC